MPAKLGPTVRQVRTYIDFLHQYDFLSTRDLNRIHHKKFERAFARTILQRKKPHIAGHEFSLGKLRSLTGKDYRKGLLRGPCSQSPLETEAKAQSLRGPPLHPEGH